MFKTVRTEMVKYVREMMLSGGVLLPTRGVIGKRIKRCYWSQRHQAHSKADKEKRRRQRFLNKRNCLAMVGLYYFSLSYSNALDQKRRARVLSIRMWIHFSREESGFNAKYLTVKLHGMLAG